MKRCNNCGWFNLDSATHCEKCHEESFELQVEQSQESAESVAAEENVSVEQETLVSNESVANLKPADEEKSVEVKTTQKLKTEAKAKGHVPNATVAFGSNMLGQDVKNVIKTESSKNLAATARFTQEDLNDVVVSAVSVKSCPKCRYPISGGMEYCPNCGATIRANLKATVRTFPLESIASETVCEQVQDVDYKAKTAEKLGKTVFITEQKRVNLKATVRDVPDILMSDNENRFRLVPVDAVGESIIELTLGEEVIIAGCRYKFQK